MGIRFRESAVKNIRSAKRTDQDIRLVSIRMWILLIVSVILVGGLLAWGILGRVPITTELMGVYTYSLGKVDICAEKNGVLSQVTSRGYNVKKGDVICRYQDGTELTAKTNCEINEVFVKPGQYVKEGETVFSAYRTPTDGVYVERAYLFVPYDQRPMYDEYLPVQLDLQGISEDTSKMKGLIFGSNDTGTITKEEAKRKFGIPELEELFEDGNLYSEVRCVPLKRGVNTTGKEDYYLGDMTSMGWMSALLEELFSKPDMNVQNLNDYYLPDMTLVKATVTLEYRRPITLLIPALQSIFEAESAGFTVDEIEWERDIEPRDPDELLK